MTAGRFISVKNNLRGETPVGYFIVRLKFQKRSALKFVSRTIPLQAEGIIPRPLGRNFGLGLALGFIPVIPGEQNSGKINDC